MVKFSLDNWVDYSGTTQIINKYPLFNNTPSTLSDALQKQAELIYEKHKDLAICLSGGIDSHQMAYGFIKAKLPVRYIFFKINFIDKNNQISYNKYELFFAQDFATKYKINLELLEITYTIKDFAKLVVPGFFENTSGIGSFVQLSILNDFKSKNTNTDIVIGSGTFTFKRDYNKCFGMLPNPRMGVTAGIDPDLFITFFLYTPLIFQYYEYIHRNTLALQYTERYQPKNLAFTELHFPLRAKYVSLEHLVEKNIQRKNFLNFGDDHDPVTGQLISSRDVLEAIFPELLMEQLTRKFDTKRRLKDRRNETILYSFNTSIDKLFI